MKTASEAVTQFTQLREIARQVGITADQAKYWVKLLGIVLIIQGKAGFLSDEDAATFREMAGLVKAGTAPKDAAVIARKANRTTSAPAPGNLPAPRSEALEEMRAALLLLVDEHRQVKTVLSSMAEENRSLRAEVSALRALLPAPVTQGKTEPSAPIRAVVLEPCQRKITFWESVVIGFNDFSGFLVGRG